MSFRGRIEIALVGVERDSRLVGVLVVNSEQFGGTFSLLFVFNKAPAQNEGSVFYDSIASESVRRVKRVSLNLVTTPKRITDQIMDFCRMLEGSDVCPIWVTVSRNGMQANNCFVNVPEKMKTDGGRSVNGWTIWEYPLMYLDAEFHCNWEKDGKLLDITKKVDGESQILFLPSSKPFEGKRVPNVQWQLSKAPVLQKYFDAHKRMEALRPQYMEMDTPTAFVLRERLQEQVLNPLSQEIFYVYSMLKKRKAK